MRAEGFHYAGVEISFATSSERELSEIHGIQHLPEAPREQV
jgi:hypothetical protein